MELSSAKSAYKERIDILKKNLQDAMKSIEEIRGHL